MNLRGIELVLMLVTMKALQKEDWMEHLKEKRKVILMVSMMVNLTEQRMVYMLVLTMEHLMVIPMDFSREIELENLKGMHWEKLKEQ